MRVKFIGTSHGVPEPNRQCSCTMIETKGRYYFIDMGVSPIDYLVTAGIPIDAVKGVFITHMHGDHTHGLIPFVDLIGWYFKTADPIIFLPNLQGANVIKEWIRTTQCAPRELRYKEVKTGVIFDDGYLKVTAFQTLHVERSYGYLLEAEGKTFLFSGDLKHPDEDFPSIAKECETDFLVLEGAHFASTTYEPHLKNCNTKTVYINHYQGKLIPSILELANNLQNVVPIKMVYDGSEIIL